MSICNFDCLNCSYDDCINDDDISTTESMEMIFRDKSYFEHHAKLRNAHSVGRKSSRRYIKGGN